MWSQAAWGCVMLVRHGTSLGLSLLIPNMGLTWGQLPALEQGVNAIPAHKGHGHCSSHLEHQWSFYSSRPHPPAERSTTLTHSRCADGVSAAFSRTCSFLGTWKNKNSHSHQSSVCAPGAQGLGSNPASVTDLLGVFGQRTQPHSASASSSVKWDEQNLPYGVTVRNPDNYTWRGPAWVGPGDQWP